MIGRDSDQRADGIFLRKKIPKDLKKYISAFQDDFQILLEGPL